MRRVALPLAFALAAACGSEPPTPEPEPEPAVPERPAAPTPDGPVVLRLYPLHGVTADPFGDRTPPEPVRLWRTTQRGGRILRTMDTGAVADSPARHGQHLRRTAEIAGPAEGLAERIASVRPWFEQLDVAEGERFLFELPEAVALDLDDAGAYLVREPGVPIHRGDIHEAVVSEHDGEAFSVRICWSEDGARRLAPLTSRYVGGEVALAVDDGVVNAPRLRGPVGVHPLTLTFLSGNRAWGDELVGRLLEGSDDVDTTSALPAPCR